MNVAEGRAHAMQEKRARILINWPEGPIGEAEGRAHMVRAKRAWILSNWPEGPIDEAEGRVHLGCERSEH